MEENMMECGKWASNMEKDYFLMQKINPGKEVFGMKEKESDGFNLNKRIYFISNSKYFNLKSFQDYQMILVKINHS